MGHRDYYQAHGNNAFCSPQQNGGMWFMDSQHLFGARGDTDSCLLLWAVHVTGVRIWKGAGGFVGWVGRGLVAAVKSKTFWERTLCQFLVVLWICDIVACGWGVVLHCISQTDVGLRASRGCFFFCKESSVRWVGLTARHAQTQKKVWYTNW